VKTAACERLLAHRVEAKVAGKRIGDVLNRMHVALPKPRAGAARPRPPVIPLGVTQARAARDAGEKRRTERDAQEEAGGAGVYSADLRKLYDLKDPAWKWVPRGVGGAAFPGPWQGQGQGWVAGAGAGAGSGARGRAWQRGWRRRGAGAVRQPPRELCRRRWSLARLCLVCAGLAGRVVQPPTPPPPRQV
jgi:hypothetical protein